MSSSAVEAASRMERFLSPRTVIGRFVARRSTRGAAFLALVLGAYVASKAAGYAAAYPTTAARERLAASFSANIGLAALLGTPHHIDTVTGFTVWNTLGVMVIIGAIWGLLVATRTFRGEEDAGRWEVLLAGQTTSRLAAANALGGLGVCLAVLYAVSSLTFVAVGMVHTVSYGTSAALFFSLAAASGAAVFISAGALASQLMPTRTRAARLTASALGVCFLLRAMADTTNARWLLNLTPLGWIEKMRPLYGSQPMWLLPIIGTVFVLCLLTIVLAGRRDLGASIVADNDSAAPRTALLNAPWTAALRLTRTASLSWLTAIALGGAFFGLLTRSAAKAFSDSLSAQHLIARLAHSARSSATAGFLGIVFFLLMTLIMLYAASAAGALREDEAVGHLDNLLVRPVGRLRWLGGRVAIISAVVVFAGLLAGASVWVGAAGQHADTSLRSLILAGINTMAAPIVVLGVAILCFGFFPRLTTVVAYGVIAWSFLIEMVSSGIELNHWLLDTSVLHHVALAPATNARWSTDVVLIVVGAGLGSIGAVAFDRRDLQGE